MSRKFIATILAASIAITGFAAAPARADIDGDDLMRFLAGAATIAIIGNAISDSRRDRPRYDYDDSHRSSDRYTPPTRSDRNWNRPRQRALPRGCIIWANTKQGQRRVMGKRCLKVHYPQAKSLPRSCKVKFNDGNGRRPGYLVRCLRNDGYRISRRN